MKRQGAAVAILLLALHFGSKRLYRIGEIESNAFFMNVRSSKIEGAIFSTDGVRDGVRPMRANSYRRDSV